MSPPPHTYAHSPGDQNLCLVAVEQLNLHGLVPQTVLVQQLDGPIDGCPGGLVIMEQVPSQQQHVHLMLLS